MKQPIKTMQELQSMVTKLIYHKSRNINYNYVHKIMWYVLRDLKTRHQFPLNLALAYDQNPYYLTYKGYQIKLPHNNVTKTKYKDYGCKSLIKSLTHSDTLPSRTDEFIQQNEYKLPKSILNQTINFFMHKSKPVKYADIPTLTDDDYKHIYQQSYYYTVKHGNFVIKLYTHIQAVLNEQNIHSKNLLPLSLFVTAYIRQNSNKFAGVDTNNPKSYSPVRPLLADNIWSSSPSFEWPDQWFRIKHDIFADDIMITNPMIQEFQQAHGQYAQPRQQSEFMEFNDSILQYSHITDKEYQHRINDHFLSTRLENESEVALDWEDLDYLSLPEPKQEKEILI